MFHQQACRLRKFWIAIFFICVIFLPGQSFSGPAQFLIPYYTVGTIHEQANGEVIGSGFLLDDPKYMVTAWHVAFDRRTRLQREIVFRPVKGLGTHDAPRPLAVEPHRVSEERDIVVMRLVGKSLAKQALVRGNTDALKPGDYVGYAGFNVKDSGAGVTTFTISADPIRRIVGGDGKRFLEILGIAIPGFSGGPVFGGNDTVLGIILRGNTSSQTNDKFLFYAAGVEQIPKFLPP
jgi:S1-C subfamily serine protease